MTVQKRRMGYGGLDASAELEEMHEGRFSRRLISLIVAGMISLLVWSAVTPVNELTSGSGTIVTQALPEKVEHPDGGVVARINVVAGSTVSAGDILLEFDTSSLRREREKLDASMIALQAEFERIDFVLENKGRVPEFEALSELEPEELLFWAEQAFAQAQSDLIDADRRAIEPALVNLKAQQSNLTRELDILGDRLTRSESAQQSGVIALNSLEAAEREYLQLERAVLELQAEIDAQENALHANALRQSELLARRNHEAALRRSEVEEQIVAAAITIEEITARIERATVRASVSGTVMDMGVSNPHEFVGPGELIAEIVPTEDRVVAEVEVSADRIGSVEVGMTARLKVLSYDFTRYGDIVGEVVTISPSSYLDELGNTVFRVTIGLPNDGRAPRIANRPVLPGMTVTADILSASKRVISYLLKPLRALGDKAFTEA